MGEHNGNGNGRVTLADAARILRVSKRTIRRWVARLGIERSPVGTHIHGRFAEVGIPTEAISALRAAVSGESAGHGVTDTPPVSSGHPMDAARDSAGHESNGQPDTWTAGGRPPDSPADSRALVLARDVQALTAAMNRLAGAMERHEQTRHALHGAQGISRGMSLGVQRLQFACYWLLAAGLVGVLALVVVAGVRLGTWAQLARWIAGG